MELHRWRASKATVLGAAFLLVPVAIAKGKPAVPGYILRAHTVAVVVDPDAGVALDDPNANQTAQKDVETALLNWGRFETVLGPQQADLVIVLRKGHKPVQETVSDPRQNSRAGVITPTEDGVSVGAQHGQQPGLSTGRAPDGASTGTGTAHPQLEVGPTDDAFTVYEGATDHPLDGAPGWRWVHKNALHAHDVPAVAEFQKAIAEAEKQAAAQAAGKKP